MARGNRPDFGQGLGHSGWEENKNLHPQLPFTDNGPNAAPAKAGTAPLTSKGDASPGVLHESDPLRIGA